MSGFVFDARAVRGAIEARRARICAEQPQEPQEPQAVRHVKPTLTEQLDHLSGTRASTEPQEPQTAEGGSTKNTEDINNIKTKFVYVQDARTTPLPPAACGSCGSDVDETSHIPVSVARAQYAGWSAEDWQAFFDERAAIAEYDGGLPRPEAEAMAYECCVAEYLGRTFMPSEPGACAQCGGAELPDDPVHPHGNSVAGHVWLHSGCWAHYQMRRRGEAIAAIAVPIPRIRMLEGGQSDESELSLRHTRFGFVAKSFTEKILP